jgi:LysR family transcriptional regulator, low CO2-responsive transcriptional regulator
MKHATHRQLKVFEAVARHLSFSRAAVELHLTQPAVSTQVKKLEEHAGVALLEQVGKRTYLTAAGEEMLDITRAILEQFSRAEDAMTQFRGISGGRLNVAVISAGDYFFPRLLVAFIKRHRGVVLNFTVHNRSGLLAHLQENRTDLAIMVRPPVDADMVSVPFAPHPYVLVAPPDHALVGARVSLDDVLAHPFVVRERGSDTRQSMHDAFGARIDEMRVALEIRSTETIKHAVMAGMGLGFLSAHTIVQEVRNRSLAILDVEGLPLLLHWYVVHRQGKRLPPVAEAFKAFLVEESAPLIEAMMALPASDADVAQPSTTTRRRRHGAPVLAVVDGCRLPLASSR